MTGVLQVLIGNGGAIVDFQNQTIDAVSSFIGFASAGYEVRTTGQAFQNLNIDSSSSSSGLDQGIRPGAATANYEIYATASGATPSGTLATWLALTSNRGWTTSQTGTGSSSTTLSLQIRPAGGSTVHSWTVDLYAEAP